MGKPDATEPNYRNAKESANCLAWDPDIARAFLQSAEKVELIETGAEAPSYFPRLAARLRTRPDRKQGFSANCLAEGRSIEPGDLPKRSPADGEKHH